MSDVIDQIRTKFPQYKDVPDEELTVAIGDKYPVYLQHDSAFSNDYRRLKGATSTVTAADSEPPSSRAPAFYPGREGEGGLYTPRGDNLPKLAADPAFVAPLPGGESVENIQAIEDAIYNEEARGTIGPSTLTLAQKIRRGAMARSLLGPTEEERAGRIRLEGAAAPADFARMALRATMLPEAAQEALTQGGGSIGAIVGPKTKAAGEAAGGLLGGIPVAFPALGPLGSRIAAAAFTADIASQLPELKAEYDQAVKEGDDVRATGLQVQALGTVLFAGIAGKHAATARPLEVAAVKAEAAGAPATAEAVRAQAETIPPVVETKPAVPETIPPPGETKAPVSETKPPGWSDERWQIFQKQRQAGIDAQTQRDKEFVPPISPPSAPPAGAPPVVDVTAKPSATRTPEAAAVEAPTPAPKWTIATEDRQPLSLKELAEGKRPPGAGEVGAISLAAITPAVKRAAKAVADTTKEALSDLRIQPLNDRRRAVLNWSAKLQQSFGEADGAQRDIRKQVPDAAQRDGITNWIQAGGDAAVLAQRAAATTDPVLKAGYEAAMNLTPEALAVAQEVKLAYDTLGQRGRRAGVLNSFVDNYVTQIWNLNKGPAMGSSRTLKDQFRFNKARTFDTFFDGEQAGYTPKTKDISQLLPVYLHEMNAVIAARQLVAQMGDGVASDGRPLTAPSGNSRVVDGADGQAVLVTPKTIKGDTQDYKRMENQPALNDWVWAGKDTDGKPIFLKSDLKLHPEAYAQLKNVLGRSAIKEWYDTRTSLLAAIPKALVKGVDDLQSETKKTMLGFFAPFHQFQEGWHGVGHRVNPTFNNPKIDLVNNKAQMDAARHGLMLLPDRVSANNFMEGYRTSGLVSRIPGIGPAADWYSHYLFHEYIPGLKFKTYEAILERNQEVYAKDLAAGEVALQDVKALSASQANAAYGHLNYADLGRNPTIQHLMRLGLLAPDFLEARARFFGQGMKGVAGAKVGREQVLALATLAIVQAALAYTAAKLTDGEWEGTRPFEFTKDGRRYTLRSVPEDFLSLMRDIDHVFEKGGETPFISHRLSPLVGRGGMQLLSGRDYRGRQVTPLQTAGELAKTPIPLTLRGAAGELPWVGDMLKPNTSLSIPEQLWSAVGIKISVDRPVKPEKPKREKPKYKP